MTIRMKITFIVAGSMAAILAINNSFLNASRYLALSGDSTNELTFLIMPISILLMCILIFYVVGIYTDRLSLIRKSFKLIQENQIVSFSIKTKDEIGEMMSEIEEVSTRLYEKETEMRTYQEEKLLLANTDTLTGLPNRDNYLARLEKENKANNGSLVVSVVVKDILKINALKGTAISNQILLEITKRILSFQTQPNEAGRMSTHHFSLYFDLKQETDWQRLEEALRFYLDQVAAPFIIEGESFFTKVQFGIAFRQPNEDVTIQNLVHLADLAVMEESGSIGHNLYLSHSLLQDEHTHKQQLEFALRKSIDDETFEVVYQPIVSLNDSHMSLETLVRWNYKDEWVSPSIFIPILEEIGLIERLTKQVMDAIVIDWHHWKNVMPDLSHISLNISAKIFEHGEGEILEYMVKVLKENELEPTCICLEITENVLLDAHTLYFIEHSMKLGFLIAIDDFGTGYSSMSYIANYPFDVLKIDREFVLQLETNEKKREVAQAIVQLAQKLGIRVVAEGVETVEQLKILSEMGTDAIQGYYFSKPQFLNEWNPLLLEEKRRIHAIGQ
ncbi:MAG: EAL domain-containing protein [Paenisporosarcina sp.]|nr:EAL domain-containing protein [Paenisporosarcina sp.]